MFVRFAQDAPDVRQVAILAVLMVEMMELIQTAHQNGLNKVTPKTNGRGLPLSLFYFLISSKACKTSLLEVFNS